jgi:hypothetical protein
VGALAERMVSVAHHRVASRSVSSTDAPLRQSLETAWANSSTR